MEGMDDWFAYKVSNDASHIFFGYDNKKLWRSVSYNATYKLWSVAEKKYIDSIFDKAEFLEHCPSGPSNIQVLQWAPKGVAGAFICDFNMYYFSDPLNMASVTKITSDGLDNEIYNGLPEWVYEEEMLGTNNAIYWSPEGTQIMFVKFQTQTTQDRLDGNRDAHIYKYSWYGQEQYPETKEISFSKAGTTPPTNKLYMFDTTTKANVELGNQGFDGEENYFARCDWLNEDNLVVVWTTRIQDKSVGHFFLKKEGSWILHPAASQPSNAALYIEENGWVGSFGPWWPKYWNEGSYFTLRSKKVGSAGPGQEGFWTVARVDIGSEEPLFLADHPSYTDTDLAHYDSGADVLYYYAAAPEPRHRQLHAIAGASKAEAASNPVCITCPLISKYPAGEEDVETRCGWINVVFHENNVIFNCRGGAGLPITVWKSLDTLMDETVDFAVLEDNAELAATLESVAMPKKVYGKYQPHTYDEKTFNFQWFKPDDFDDTKKYALVIEVYAGPEFQKVTDEWSPDFCQSMVSEYDIICASVDGRGSAFEGDAFMQQVYKKLGQNEPADQTDFGSYMASLDFIDESKIAIWGWSYGGYTTTHTLAYGNNGKNDVFKCGVAVAPLASWRYYDIMYAERYLGKPQDNEEAYDKAEIWYKAENGANAGYEGFKHAWYTMIHGTADDNVHFMSAAHMEKKLVEADVDFDNFYYADEDHSIRSSPEVNYHVYQNIRRHLLNHRCLDIL